MKVCMELKDYLKKTGIALASRNRKKAAELSRLLESYGIPVKTAAELGFDEDIPETAETFEGNAFLKADTVCRALNIPVMADDSGLCVDALEGAPGVWSARYGGEGLDDSGRVQHLLQNMKDVPTEKRTARFVSVICLVLPESASASENVWYFRGEAEGLILNEIKGEGGFGYDPVFLDKASGLTFAELDPSSKDAISHRGKAVRLFLDLLGRQI